VFYNEALFKKAGISAFPSTWADLLAACTRLKAAKVIRSRWTATG